MGDFCRKIERRASKDHRCIECKGTIQQGEKYHYYSGAWEGAGFSVKRCKECDSIASRYIMESNCMDDERPAFGELAYHLFESDISALQQEFVTNRSNRGGLAA